MAKHVPTLKASLATAISSLHRIDPNNDLTSVERHRLFTQLNELSAVIAPPEVAIQKFCFSFHGLSAAKIAKGMGVFEAFAFNGFGTVTLDGLDARTKGDRELLVRIMRMLTAHNLVKETGKHTWAPLPLAKAFGSSGPASGILDWGYFQLQPTSGLYTYLSSTSFTNPRSAVNGPFQHTMQTPHHLLTYLDSLPDPTPKAAFNAIIQATSSFRGQDWFDFFPLESKLNLTHPSSMSPDKPLLVDIAGNTGTDLLRLHTRFPQLPGKLILQDLPSVIAAIPTSTSTPNPLPDKIVPMAHDMFTPQPIKHARFYYLRLVLHDWPDEQALQILQRTKEAMGPESVLLINENIVPEVNAPPVLASVDYFMMDLWGAQERTEEAWRELIGRAGLRVAKLWRPMGADGGKFGVLEVVKVEGGE